MSKSLGAATFCWNGIIQDYCFKETIASLLDAADQIAIHAGGTDGTYEEIEQFLKEHQHEKNVILTKLTEVEWYSVQGREKLSVFSNVAINNLTTDWFIYVQCDEILDESSIPYIRHAIEHTDVNAFFVRRWNMWKDDKHILNVEPERKPCSDVVIRLAKKGAICFDDAEGLMVDGQVAIYGNIDLIQLWHVGFIRDGKKHLVKIKHMLTEVFGWSNDTRAENCETFIPERFFSDSDLIPIPKPLPKYVTKWAEERYPA